MHHILEVMILMLNYLQPSQAPEISCMIFKEKKKILFLLRIKKSIYIYRYPFLKVI